MADLFRPKVPFLTELVAFNLRWDRLRSGATLPVAIDSQTTDAILYHVVPIDAS